MRKRKSQFMAIPSLTQVGCYDAYSYRDLAFLSPICASGVLAFGEVGYNNQYNKIVTDDGVLNAFYAIQNTWYANEYARAPYDPFGFEYLCGLVEGNPASCGLVSNPMHACADPIRLPFN